MARRTAEAAAQTRADIVSAARALFAQSGYAATTTAEVAARAGVTIGAVFHHFKGKADLFAAVFDELDREMDAYARERAVKVMLQVEAMARMRGRRSSKAKRSIRPIT